MSTSSPTSSEMAEPSLNATPLIDVLLVLLVMLIFTIPVMTHKVALTLPKAAPPGAPVPEIIELAIDFDGLVTWNGSPVESLPVLEQRLRAAQTRVPAPSVQLRADPRARYEGAAQVLAATQRARVTNLAIVGLSRL